MTYQEHQKQCAFYGFTHCEITETGFNELKTLGFDLEDMFSIECDIQAGFTAAESIKTRALTKLDNAKAKTLGKIHVWKES